MEPLLVIMVLVIGGFIGAVSHQMFGVRVPKTKDQPVRDDYQTQIDSLRTALHEAVKNINEKSERKISRVDNKELFDRIDSLEKADKQSIVVRHDHYYTELPKTQPRRKR